MNRTDPKTPNAAQGRIGSSTKNNPPLSRICISVREAAEISGLSRSTIYNLIHDGRLIPAKVGGRKLIWLEDLYKFLRDAKQNQ